MQELSREQEAILIIMGLKGGHATMEEVYKEILRLGVYDMSVFEYDAWKESIKPELARQYRLAVERGEA
jgi:hypothetical protein